MTIQLKEMNGVSFFSPWQLSPRVIAAGLASSSLSLCSRRTVLESRLVIQAPSPRELYAQKSPTGEKRRLHYFFRASVMDCLGETELRIHWKIIVNFAYFSILVISVLVIAGYLTKSKISKAGASFISSHILFPALIVISFKFNNILRAPRLNGSRRSLSNPTL